MNSAIATLDPTLQYGALGLLGLVLIGQFILARLYIRTVRAGFRDLNARIDGQAAHLARQDVTRERHYAEHLRQTARLRAEVRGEINPVTRTDFRALQAQDLMHDSADLPSPIDTTTPPPPPIGRKRNR